MRVAAKRLRPHKAGIATGKLESFVSDELCAYEEHMAKRRLAYLTTQLLAGIVFDERAEALQVWE